MTNGLPIAFGATDFAIRPASTTTVTTYGIIWISEPGMRPDDWQVDAFELDLDRAEKAEHQAAQHRVDGRQLPNTRAVSAR